MSNTAADGQPKKQHFGYLRRTGKEFKDFINRGNIVDLAVAVIMGAAFGAIVTSFVNDLIMPFITAATGKSISDLSVIVDARGLTDAQAIAAASSGVLPEGVKTTGDQLPIVVFYGKFIQAVVYFLIVAIIMFFVVKGYMALRGGNKNKHFGYTKQEYKAFRAQGMNRDQIRQLSAKRDADAAAKAKADAEEAAKNSAESILKDIRGLLQKQLER